MLGSTNPTLTDTVFKFFIQNPGSTTKQAYLALKKSHKISMQNVYKIINKLLEGKVLVKQNTALFVSQEWVLRVQSLLPTAAAFDIGQDESARWSFNSLEHLDAFWKHVMLQLSQTYQEEPMFIANPHNIWPYAPEREESEERFFETFAKANRHVYYTTKGATQKDKETNKKIETSHIHFSHNANTLPLQHIVVIGNIISTTKLSKQDEHHIDMLYNDETTPTEEFEARLISLLQSVTKASFKIEHNPTKARTIRKKIAKDFYVPQEDIEKFNLW